MRQCQSAAAVAQRLVLLPLLPLPRFFPCTAPLQQPVVLEHRHPAAQLAGGAVAGLLAGGARLPQHHKAVRRQQRLGHRSLTSRGAEMKTCWMTRVVEALPYVLPEDELKLTQLKRHACTHARRVAWRI